MRLTLQAWLGAGRPKTLPLAWLAILIGSLLALAEGAFSWPVLLLSLLTASLLQILSNLANDYGDGMRGVDNQQRLGPVRALQSGMLNARQLRGSLFLVAGLSITSGLALMYVAALDPFGLLLFVGLGLLAIIAALTYTLGRRPYGYAGLGDVSVWLFFGCLGVLGSCHLHGVALSASLLLPAAASGFLAVAVLNVNNMRDLENDARCGKYTLAVRLGFRCAQLYHFVLLGAALLLFAVYLLIYSHPGWLNAVFLFAVVPVYRHGRAVWRAGNPAGMAPLLPAMVSCAVVVSLLFAVPVMVSTALVS